MTKRSLLLLLSTSIHPTVPLHTSPSSNIYQVSTLTNPTHFQSPTHTLPATPTSTLPIMAFNAVATPPRSSTPNRNSDEMIFLGQSCNHDACSLVDFLPLKVRSLISHSFVFSETLRLSPSLPTHNSSVSILQSIILFLTPRNHVLTTCISISTRSHLRSIASIPRTRSDYSTLSYMLFTSIDSYSTGWNTRRSKWSNGETYCEFM
jgi:hypothetical protein